jgi:beta-N-acetylhexosaminidase
MVSSAIYSKLDPEVRAVFSRPVVTGLLRETLDYDGVVVSDDLGGAAAVAGTPAAERATRFVAAGGDIVLTGLPQTVPTMAAALRDKATAEPGFAAQVDAAATRVLELKAKRGVATC